jgi:hypothetical protein
MPDKTSPPGIRLSQGWMERWKGSAAFRIGQLMMLIGVVILATGWVAEQVYLQIRSNNVIASFSTLLSHSHGEVQELSEVLASDYGLRESLLTNDPYTIDSTLQNHRKRVSAQRMLAISGDAQIIGDTDQRITRGVRLAQSNLAPVTSQKITTLHVTEGKLFRYARAVIRAPGPAGELLVGYDMEQRLAKDAGELMNMKVAFACAVDKSNMRINRGSFSEAARPALEKLAQNPSSILPWARNAGSEKVIASLNLDTSTGERCIAILGESAHPSNNALLIVELFGWLTLIIGLSIFSISGLMARSK